MENKFEHFPQSTFVQFNFKAESVLEGLWRVGLGTLI